MCSWDRSKGLTKDILIFCTGTDKIPSGGFHLTPTVSFLHDDQDTLATASTCDLSLWLPVIYDDQIAFNEMFTLCLKGSVGFGKV